MSTASFLRRFARVSSGLAFALFVLFATAAQADVAPMNLCDEVGSSCTTDDGRSGTCEASTCSRLSYGGGTPETVTYDCNQCAPGPSSGCQASSGGTSPFGVAGMLLLVAMSWSVLLIRKRKG